MPSSGKGRADTYLHNMNAITLTPEPFHASDTHGTTTLTPQLLRKMDAYWRAANYLSVGQI